jgi:ubiquinone/menaquinone biosynthesis C-methylase UbiE
MFLRKKKKPQVTVAGHPSYPEFVQEILNSHPRDEAMQMAVGGEFEALGLLEKDLLIQLGLRPNDYLIDVGCGSGRLAKPLSEYLAGLYLGIDVVPELVDYARTLVDRPDWRFEVADGFQIPERDGRADWVCFFSVFTHLLHEQSYLYLQEAKRVLKPNGKIIFSFLEFAIPVHWELFQSAIDGAHNSSQPLTMFLSRDAIHAWAERLGLRVEHIQDGDVPHIPLSAPVVFSDGKVFEGKGKLGPRGQSVCVLRV